MNIDVLSLQHAFRDGRLEEVVLRHLGNEDGQTDLYLNEEDIWDFLLSFSLAGGTLPFYSGLHVLESDTRWRKRLLGYLS
ncbi:hypothetical protein TorRG33x02_228750 [Trema orientale]|uniref:Uncharacterized protein n=1 Tax=Trema orientale TaxID=63057 RepID=A0A2P5E716_TREOI|nr:hypothetical protein TorRG33x02_228750 [Trema orientale]